jgi:hypothetical protein
MAYIERRKTPDGKTSYRIKIRLKGFPTQTATLSRKTDAKKWAQSTETAIREGQDAYATLDDALRDLEAGLAACMREQHL